MLNAFVYTCFAMKNIKQLKPAQISILDVAIYFGVIALFFAISVPLIRGALVRQRMAECARKMMHAADAFDLYADRRGHYPSCRIGLEPNLVEMRELFGSLGIDWWDQTTEMGGEWEWFRGGKLSGSVAIFKPHASENQMRKLDELVDDGNLHSGIFQQYGSRYCYVLRRQDKSYASSF